jgi:hypothetical protein
MLKQLYDITSKQLIQIFSYDNKIRVINPEEHVIDITVFNLIGKKFKDVTASSVKTDIPVFESGYYLVKAVVNNDVIIIKAIIK